MESSNEVLWKYAKIVHSSYLQMKFWATKIWLYFAVKLSNGASYWAETWYTWLTSRGEHSNDSFSAARQREILVVQHFLALERLIRENKSLR